MYVFLFLSCIIAVLAIAGSIFLISRNRKIESENKLLKKQNEDIQNSLVEQDRYLAYTSHEIRTPLNAIAGGAQLIAKTELDEKQKKYLTAIRSGVDSALLIVNDILDLSKIDSNMVEVHPVDFMLTEVMNGVRNILQYRAEQKGIEFHVHLDEKIPAVIKGDAKHLNQILINLSTNAIKFTDLGKVEVLAEMVEEKDDRVYLRFKVIDTGKGIRKSNLATIFNQYEQETRHTIKHAGGTGLGLAITKKLVELQGGKISVESQYLQGTTFQVDLSFGKSDPLSLKKEPVQAENVRKLDNIRVLLVDDNVINREILNDLLKDLNPAMEISMAENGETAVNKLYSGNFDMVLMDIQMPKMNGFEASTHIRKNMKYPISEIPIIAMTAHALENVAEECFRAGMNDYIAKPIEIDFLANKMIKLLDKKKGVQEKYNKYKVIDLNHLKELTRENEERMQKYIGIFLQNAPADLDTLRQCAESMDVKGFREMAHKIKGNVAYMGIRNLAEVFAASEYGKIEHLSKEELLTLNQRIASVCLQAIDELQEIKKVL